MMFDLFARSRPARILVFLSLLAVPLGFAATAGAVTVDPAPAAACPTPSLLTPGNGASVTCPVELSWSPINTSGSYRVFVINENGNVVVDKVQTATSRTEFLPSGNYEWYVSVASTSCATTTSAHAYFRVTACCPSTGPALLTPADRGDVESPVRFTWNSVSEAKDYVFHLLRESVEVNRAELTGRSVDLTLEAGTYEWYVDARFSGDCPPVASVHRLVKVAAPAPVCPAAGPVLSGPSDGATESSPVRFSWSGVGNATSYRFNLVRNGVTVVSQTQSATSIELALEPGAYSWGVEALAANCPARSSSQRALNVRQPVSNCPKDAPKQLSPDAGASLQSTSVNFSWNSVINATGYVLRVYEANGIVLEKKLSGTSTTETLPIGKYGWVVIATADGCDSVVSSLRELSVIPESDPCPQFGPRLMNPQIGSKLKSPVTFTWLAVTGATQYRLVIATSERIVLDETRTETSVRRELQPGDYVWWVEALTSNCDPVSSDRFFFSILSTGTSCPSAPPSLLSPSSNTETGSPVRFSWSPVTGATSYNVVVTAGDSIVLEEEVTDTFLESALDPGIYSWIVEALAKDCAPRISTRTFFAVTCANGAPTLLAPADGASVPSTVQFSWTPVSGARAYLVQVYSQGDVYVSKNTETTTATFELRAGGYKWVVLALFDQCPPEASKPAQLNVDRVISCPAAGPVLIEPASDAAVTSLPVQFKWDPVAGTEVYWLLLRTSDTDFRVVAETNQTMVSLDLPSGAYAWLVVANARNCEGRRSSVRKFTIPQASSCDHGKPSLIQPSDGASVTPPITFAWSPVSGALGYQLFLMSETGPPTPVLKTTETSATLDELRPGRYASFVVALFDRCPPTASEPSKIEVPLQTGCDHRSPFLLSPASGEANVSNPVFFSWTPVPDAVLYRLWIAVDDGDFSSAGETTETKLSTTVSSGLIRWVVQAEFDGCPSVRSQPSRFTTAESGEPCGVTAAPRISVVGSASSGETYVVRWSALANADSYELDEATTPDFREPTTETTPDLSLRTRHEVVRETAYFYRVRGIDECTGDPGPYSRVVRIVIRPPISPEARGFDLVKELGDLDVINQTITADTSEESSSSSKMAIETSSGSRRHGVMRPEIGFTASSNVPWLTVSPSSGSLSGGVAELTATADPSSLPPGTSSAYVTVSTGVETSTTTGGTVIVPVSISLVTPVAPGALETPPPDALIVPLVSHESSGEEIQSYANVAISNVSASATKYQVSFRSLDDDGSVSELHTDIQLEPGQTSSLEDVVASWFGAEDGATTGVIEIRSLDEPTVEFSSSSSVIVSAIQFAAASSGTLGEYVPALPLSSFAALASETLVVPGIEAGSTEVSSIGLVEGSGQDATVSLSVYDGDNQMVAEESVTLLGGESTSLSDILGALSISGGRAEITVTSGSGQVTAYNRLANPITGDSRLITAQSAVVSTETQIVAGVSDVSEGTTTRRTDLWLYNPSQSEETVSLTFYPEAAPESSQANEITLGAGESRLVNSAVGTLFGQFGVRGAIHVVSTNGVMVSASEHVESDDGSTGSVLPVISASQAVGVDESPLQMLHVTESSRYTSGIGLAEVTGSEATIEVTATVPGALAAPTLTLTLEGNEFREIGSIIAQMGFGDTSNARVSVRVVAGAGRVTSYAALADRETSDVTVIPAGR